ncbi:MAG: thiolase domain-containing protein [Thermoprotei archaeon]
MYDVGIIGVGYYGFKPTTPEVSFREMMFEAASRAYTDAGVDDPRKTIDAFVTCEEDFWSGISIFDEFTPDQLGGVYKPVYTIAGDGLVGLASAYMKIRTGLFDIVIVEAHSKASEIITLNDIINFAYDPIYNRPLGLHPYFLAGLEATKYLHRTGGSRHHLSLVVEKNKTNALKNPLASYASKITAEDVDKLKPVIEPLNSLDIARPVDVSVVVVLARGDIAKKFTDKIVWIDGIGWATENPNIENRIWGHATYTRIAANMAYKLAGIKNPSREFDMAIVDDKFSYKELEHIEALGLTGGNNVLRLLEDGEFSIKGSLPVNPHGGELGVGWALEASGLVAVLEGVYQLRNEAIGRQVPAKKIVIQSWRGIPTTTGAVAVLSSDN